MTTRTPSSRRSRTDVVCLFADRQTHCDCSKEQQRQWSFLSGYRTGDNDSIVFPHFAFFVLLSSMPVVLSKFDKTSVEFGDNWLDSIAPVFKECSLHAVLLRGQVERRTLMVRASFGHRLPKDTTNQFHPLGPGVLTSSKRCASVADSDFWIGIPCPILTACID